MEICGCSEWLLQNAGPVIRYRTATELLQNENKNPSLEKELLTSNLVRFWLENLNPNPDRKTLHGAKTESYENVMGKLYEFGLKKGEPVIDTRMRPFRRWMKEQIRLPNEGYLPVFYRTLTAAFLVLTGYSDDEAVKEWVLRRLNTVYAFAKEGSLKEAYVSQTKFPGFPKGFRKTPLLNPELYPNDELKLPWIHDINAFLHAPFIMEDANLREKVESIVKFVLTPAYQRLHVGYGVVRHQSGRYYAMGWSVHVPAYFESNVSSKEAGHLLLLLKLLSPSKAAREHAWFKRSIQMLTRFKGENGLMSFPQVFLPEKRFGCWILGHRMALEENRRAEKAILCESTFRFLEITSRNACA